MPDNRNSSAIENPTTMTRRPVPFVGATSLIAGTIMPVWMILATIAGGPEAGGWVPLVMLIGFPYYLVSLALLVIAVVCGIFALRASGADRVLGLIGLILAGIQLLVAALLFAAFASAIFAG